MHDIPAQALTRRVSHRAAGYVAHNRELAELAERSGLEPMHMIPLGVDIDLFPAGAYPRPPVLLYAGRIRPEKGMAVLAEALPLILDAAPEARIHIAGDGPMKEALRRAVPAAHADRVQFLGTIPVPDLAREYATARAVLVPSVWKENFALVGPEAMAAATPVVASDLGGIREWLRHEENGLAVPPGDARALADASLRLLRDAELAARLGVEARRSAESMSMARHAEALATLYRSCLPRS
jgi:glycosyltransferase involved in cell wall biosynthesis